MARAGGEHFFTRQHAQKPCLHSPYTASGPYDHRDFSLGALVPVLLKARRGFEAEGPKMLQLLDADDWTLDFIAARPQDWPVVDGSAVVEKVKRELAAQEGREAALSQMLADDTSATALQQRNALCVRTARHPLPPPQFCRTAPLAQSAHLVARLLCCAQGAVQRTAIAAAHARGTAHRLRGRRCAGAL
jgi:hypothetical protein